MRNVKMLNWEIEINTPVEKVWHTMLDAESYKVWTLEFNPGGSWYEKENVGDFVEGERIKFLGPGQDGKMGGMMSTIKTVRKYEYISIEHYGFIMDGVEDTESESVKSWAPAHENYTFENLGENKTLLKVSLEMSGDWVDMMNSMWPKALAKLKEICEK